MQPHARAPRYLAILLAGSLLTTGCYSNIAIRPTELPKLTPVPSASSPGGETDGNVIGSNGRIVQIRDHHDVVITTTGAAPRTFEHPVRVSAQGTVLVIQSANHAETRIDGRDIQRVEIVQLDVGGTITTAIVVPVTAAIAATLGLLLWL